MANGIAIKDVDNKLQSLEGNEVIPISTGANEPEVVEVDTLKEYINEDIDTALEGKQDVINDLTTIRSGAALGATAIQSESDPTVPAWAKAEQKPSYTASEVGAVPITRKINNKALSSDITLTAADVNALSSSTVIPAAQIQSDWNQSNTSAKDYIKNKPEIPVLPTLADVATSGDYEDLTNTPTIPDVPEWAMSSTKPSYTVSEIDGAQEELVSGTNIKTINNESILGSGNITIQGGGGDVNVIESITFNGSTVPVDSSKNAAITYSAPVTSVNGDTGAVTISVPTKVSDLTNDSGFITSYTETDPTVPSWAKASTKPSYTAAEVGALPDTTVIPTESTVSGWGFTKNAGTITGITMNGASKGTSGVVDLGTVITSHQDISGKENTSNKVTSLSSSSTDTQYPSAKAVFDLVSSIPVSSGGVWVDITSKFTTWTASKYISSANGSLNSSSVAQSFACDYVDISDYTNIQIAVPQMDYASSPAGGCFYDASKQVITPGISKAADAPQGMYPHTFAVPIGAKYIRTTWRKDFAGTFSCYGFTKITIE